MPKTNTPFFSLGSQGTVGGVLTTQKRGQETIVRGKPIPAYRRTLPQQYQRWLYEDYAYLWTQQSTATRQEYASAGVRHHLTGFQYWMKVMLSTMPDIVGWWKLDVNTSLTTPDTSLNKNTATVFGASPASGVIGPCFLFDAINDYLQALRSPSLDITGEFTIEALIYPTNTTGAIATKHWTVPRERGYMVYWLLQRIRIAIGSENPAWPFALDGNTVLPLNTWHHLLVLKDATHLRIYANGIDDGSLICGVPTLVSAVPLWIGRDVNADVNTFPGYIDNVIIYKRALDPTEVKRHSLRRYPA